MAATAAFQVEAGGAARTCFRWSPWNGRPGWARSTTAAPTSSGRALAVTGPDQAGQLGASRRSRRGPTELQPQAFDVTLVDPGQAITRIIKGKVNPRRSRVTCAWRPASSPRRGLVHPVRRHPRGLGVRRGAGTLTLHCKTDDRVLLGRMPKPQFTKGAFPGAPNEQPGALPARWCWASTTARRSSAAGMIGDRVHRARRHLRV